MIQIIPLSVKSAYHSAYFNPAHRIAVLLAFTLALSCLKTFAMDIPPELRKKFAAELEGNSENDGIKFNLEGIDNGIDEGRYLVGGGDVFEINILNLPSKAYSPIIGSDGNLYDDELGLITLGRITLKEAREKIASHVRNHLRKDFNVRVVLKKAKTATISLTGGVQNPGSYKLDGTSRLIDALKAANDGALPDINYYNLRKVIVRQGDSVRVYDLYRFLTQQDQSVNPYVYPGDQIHIEPIEETIYVIGEVQSPTRGVIPLLQGESLESLLGTLRLKTGSVDSSIIRHQKGGNSLMTEIYRRDASSIILNDGDMIYLPSKRDFLTTDTIHVTGRVLRPGVYPIQAGKTTAQAALISAGGATAEGDTINWIILRHAKIQDVQGLPSGPRASTNVILANSKYSATGAGAANAVRPEARAALADLFQSGDYALIQPTPGHSTLLMPGDELFIPAKDPYVYLSGRVENPRPVLYNPSWKFEDYVNAAGGYSEKADLVNIGVLTSHGGAQIIKSPNYIRPGDVLVIPSSIEYKRLGTVYLPIIQTIATVATTILTGFVVYNQIK